MASLLLLRISFWRWNRLEGWWSMEVDDSAGTSGWKGGGVTTCPATGDVAARLRRAVIGNVAARLRVNWGQ
jgi:hypothetical protein